MLIPNQRAEMRTRMEAAPTILLSSLHQLNILTFQRGFEELLRLETDGIRIVEFEVEVLVGGVSGGDEADPWLLRRGRAGQGGSTVLGGVEEDFAGAGVLGVGVFAHGFRGFKV